MLENEGPSEDEDEVKADPDEPNYLIWRRLQLSKAKLKGVTEMAALMAGFSVVSPQKYELSSFWYLSLLQDCLVKPCM